MNMSERDRQGREAWEAWEAEAPPEGFVDRVMAAAGQAPTTAADPGPRPDRSRRLRLVLVGSALAAAVATGTALLLVRPVGQAAEGSLSARERSTVPIGGRGVAVAEPGADLAWRVASGGAARVVQGAGNVFYRVEPGGAFLVATPAGEVTVAGTCFRVEVIDMLPSKQAVVGALVGAGVTAAALVTVYEGRVLLANEKGKTEVKAGQQARLEPGAAPAAPSVATRDGEPAATAANAPALSGPPDNATREELLLRDRAQRAELGRLRAQVAALEQGKGRPRGGPRSNRKWLDLTKEDLLELAKDCSVQYDLPPFGPPPFVIPPRVAADAGLTEAERAAANQAIAEMQSKLSAQLRALYIEVTGNSAGADELSPQAMENEIAQKSSQSGNAAVSQAISMERAGLAQPPANLASRPAAERMIRFLAAFGDAVEQRLAMVVGPEKAHALRAAGDGWPMKVASAGCPGGRDEDDQDTSRGR
jgi:hypothetical protein